MLNPRKTNIGLEVKCARSQRQPEAHRLMARKGETKEASGR
jgi:hypothetical protein